MSGCKCDLCTKLVGDGCEVCNPALALEHAKERIVDLEDDYADLIARHNALLEAVKWMLYIDTPENFEGGKHIKARAEVDRLLGES